VNARKALLSLAALMAVSLASCGTFCRAGKDLFLGVGTPVLMVYGGATDGHEAAVGVRKGLGSGSMMEVVAFPFTFAYYAFEHGLYGCIHIIDFFFFPFYGLAELHPNGPEIKPLDFYHGTWFDKWAQSDKGTDAESGQSMSDGR
jgi:hypothetical protein